MRCPRVVALLAVVGTAAVASAGERKYIAEPFAHPVLKFWLATTKAPSYDKAAAHDPHFEDKALWPDELRMDGDPAYMSQGWAAARLLVWNRRDGDKKAGGQVDMMDPRNWLEGGKPATRPPDNDTDVLFPSADKPYYALCSHGNKHQVSLPCRHITVGTNANVSVFGCRPRGNWWVKAGGSIYERHGGGFAGSNHAFARNDNVPGCRPGLGLLRPPDWTEEKCPLLQAISQYIHMQKPGGSLEAVGNWSTTDQFHVDAGTLIVAPLSAVGTGGRASLHVQREGVLQLQSGSVISKRRNQAFNWDAIVKGVLRAGSDDRPVRRDAVVGLSAKDYVGDIVDLREYGSRLGLKVEGGGKVEVHRAGGSEARLVFQWHGIDLDVLREPPQNPGSRGYDNWKRAIEGAKSFPRTVTLDFPADLPLEHVAFDDIRLGGIQGVTAEQVAGWKDIEWRARNQGAPEWLTVPGDWYAEVVCRQGWPTVAIPPGKPLMLELRSPSLGAAVRYTTDGSEPTSQSPEADGPVRIDATTTVRARAFVGGKAKGKGLRVDCLSPDKPIPAVKGGGKPGLTFRAGAWREDDGQGRVTGKTEGTAPATGTVEKLTGKPAEQYGAGGNQVAELSGFLTTPAEGSYELWLTTDFRPTAEVFLGGVRVLSTNSRSKSDSCRIALAKGAHELLVRFRRTLWGSGECKLEWKSPTIARQEVPAGAYSH